MLTLEEVAAALERHTAEWSAGPATLELLQGVESGTVFGLAVSETERDNMMAHAAQLEDETGLLAGADPPPSRIEWREEGHITPAKNQGQCQSCVAFATCACMEARISISYPEMHLDLSEAQLFACGAGVDGCTYGWQPEAALEQAKLGIGLEEDFLYHPQNQVCQEITPVARVLSWSAATSTEGRKRMIASYGPVIAGMRVYEDLPFYQGGRYEHVTGNFTGLHMVCVTGYDDAAESWTIKNSWGSDWGEDGSFRLKYGECGLDSEWPFYDPEVELI